ncbi:MAG: hypothetical protein II293_02870 [Bacteroidaceae bacterium]|nr:hypothetical protein [Bacteroidaceae bacterium]
MKNNVNRPALLLLVASIVLVCLRFVPSFTILGYEVKSVDLLSDLLTAESSGSGVGDLGLMDEEQKVKEFKCPEGVVCIEDYGQGKPSGMSSFYKALDQRDSLGRPVRIAYFGDSFVEGDILTADLRELLQKEYGGCGVGYLAIAPEAPGFRKSVAQSFAGWEMHQSIDKEGFVAAKQGITQSYAFPRGYSYTDVVAADRYSCASHFETSTFYLVSNYPVNLNVNKNNGEQEVVKSQGTGKVEAVSVQGEMKHVRWGMSGGNGVLCHGVAVEGKTGIVLDNFAMRSTSGVHLLSLDTDYLKALNAVRPYDLIILHYGLNVAGKNTTNYDGFVGQISQVIRKFKECFPNTSILITSVGDRESKVQGELHTMPGVLALIQYQQKLAADNEVAFWNLYEGMGGDGSIVKLAEKKPAEARKDYTHITHEGGRTLAEPYFKAIVAGYEQYQIMEK